MSLIALFILCNLRLPVRAIRRGEGSVLRTAMPKAAIDEHGNLPSREGEIGANTTAATWFDRKVDAIPESGGMRGAAHRALGTRIPALIRTHDLTSCLGNPAPPTEA